MDITELRPGNWVLLLGFEIEDGHPDYGAYGPIASINDNVVQFENGQLAGVEQIEPIPITHEWLLEFGFEGKSFTTGEYEVDTYELNDFKFHYASFGERAFEYQDEEMEYPAYVHRLQNLYFQLTGSELAFGSD